MKTLIHYTSLLNAFRILHSRSVKMGNIFDANDYLEKNSIDGEFRTILTFCCSQSEFSVPMWLSYSGRKDGAALLFTFKDSSSLEELVPSTNKYKVDSFFVEYIPNYVEEIGDDLNKIGRYKDSSFEYESEYRYIIDFDSEIDFDVFCQVNFDCLESVTIIVNKNDKKMVETIMKSFDYPNGFLKVEINELID